MQKPKILVVEDERDVSKVISVNLKLEGMDVVEAYDGPSALEMIEKEKPDCVVLDIMLPKVSGWDILEEIKSNPETLEMPVVMVTAKVAERDQLRGLGHGAVKYLTKPFSPITLTETIKSVLKPQAREEVARERREAIERLQLSALHKISEILISAPTLSELLEGIAGKLMDLFDLPACALILIDNGESEVYAFRESGTHLGKGKSISRSGISQGACEVLKQVFSTRRRPIEVREVDGFELDIIFPDSAPEDRGYVIPLFEHNRYLGSIVVPVKEAVTYSADEEDLLITIANQVAAAVDRARLHENLREDEIVHRRLLHQTITAQESERRRVASEIHDGVVQSLVGISFSLQALEKKIPEETNIRKELQPLKEQLNDSIKQIRDLLVGIRPSMVEDMGLVAALRNQLKDFGIKNDMKTTLNLPDEIPDLTMDSQVNIFRIIQEALNNIEKHAEAKHVTVEIEASPQKLYLTVRDDGKGFSPQKEKRESRHLGIANMRERTQILGGSFKLNSEPEHGTSVSLDIPLRAIME